jgi:predicted anti-sigma-YlaC factor YlaD
MAFMLNCKQASRKLSEAEDRKLGLGERVGLWAHLGMCTACTNFSKQVVVLRKAMQQYRDPRD